MDSKSKNDVKRKALIESIDKGDEEGVKALIKDGVSLNFILNTLPWGFRKTPLFIAVKNNNVRMLQLLLENGADPCLGDLHGTLIYEIIRKVFHPNDIQMLKMLIKHGHSVDGLTPDGISILAYAVERKKNTLAKILLKNGASPFEKNDNIQNLPLVIAMLTNEEMVDVLLEYDYHIHHLIDGESENIINIACKLDNLKVLKRVLGKFDLRDEKTYMEAFKTALFYNKKRIVMFLLDNVKIDLNKLLFFFINHKMLPMIKELVKRGVDLNNQEKNIVLYIMHYDKLEDGLEQFFIDEEDFADEDFADDEEIILYFLEQGVTFSPKELDECIVFSAKNNLKRVFNVLIEKPGLDLNKYLFQCISMKRLDKIKEIVSGGFDINNQEKDVLYFAIRHVYLNGEEGPAGIEDIILYLLGQGATCTDEELHLCIFDSIMNNYMSVFVFLLDNFEVDLNKYLFICAENIDMLKELVKRGVALDNPEKNVLDYLINLEHPKEEIILYLLEKGAKCSPEKMDFLIIKICKLNYFNAFKHLVDNGINVDVTIEGDVSSLTAAVALNDTKIFDYMFSSEANIVDPNKPDGRGFYPIVRCLTYQDSTLSSTHMLRILLQKGASPNVGTPGETPLFTCFSMIDSSDGIEFTLEQLGILLDHGANINERDSSGKTLLMLAISEPYYEIVSFLIIRGASILPVDNNGHTVIHHIMFHPDGTDIMEFILDNFNLIDDLTTIIKNNYIFFRQTLHLDEDDYLFDPDSYSEEQTFVSEMIAVLEEKVPFLFGDINDYFGEIVNNGSPYLLFGEDLEDAPIEFIFWFSDYLKKWKEYCSGEEHSEGEIDFIVNLLRINPGKTKEESCSLIVKYIEKYIEEYIDTINFENCHNSNDFVSFEPFESMNNKEIYLYGEAFGENKDKRHCISEKSLEGLLKGDGLKIKDPISRKPLLKERVYPSGKILVEEFLRRKMF